MIYPAPGVNEIRARASGERVLAGLMQREGASCHGRNRKKSQAL